MEYFGFRAGQTVLMLGRPPHPYPQEPPPSWLARAPGYKIVPVAIKMFQIKDVLNQRGWA